MKEIEIKELDLESLKKIDCLCIPKEELNDPVYIEGRHLWKEWIVENLKKYDSVGKIASLDSDILGYIQYIPKPIQSVVEIKCIYASKDERKEWIKERLLKTTIEEFEKTKPYFDDEKAKALVVYPYPVPKGRDEGDFFMKNDFKVSSKDKNLLFFPLKENFEPVSEKLESRIQPESRNKALIYCNASCPYCVKEMTDALQLIREVDTDIPVKIIVPFEKTERLNESFSMPTSVVINDELIRFPLLDDENFLKKLKDKLDLKKLEEEDMKILEMNDELRKK